MSDRTPPQIGLVAIGRNEGQRLIRCLESVVGRFHCVVYVDSGSDDGSVEAARAMGVEVVGLDMSRPFTAARARNEGVARLKQVLPGVEFVQFVDGDCVLDPGWIDAALDAMHQDDTLGVACGRRREMHPEHSVYNRMIDLEWDTPVGEADACGGDALIRTAAFDAVDGYDASVIAGEEPEMCLRMRQSGWTIRRIDHEMTLHDSALTRFGQWWKRAARAGHAFAEGAWMHGSEPERHYVKPVVSILVWTLMLPLVALALAPFTQGLSLAALAGLYVLQWWRIGRGQIKRGRDAGDARVYAALVLITKFAQLQGAVRFAWGLLSGRRSAIMEYKSAVAERPTDERGVPRLTIAYLTTQYPSVSHTFIRREIRGLEALGHRVVRLAIRRTQNAIVDDEDLKESKQTYRVLSQMPPVWVRGCLRTFFGRPIGALRALAATVRMGRKSDRGVLKHIAYWLEAMILLGKVRDEKVDHVHAHFGTNSAAVARLMRLMGGPPYSFTVHGPDELDNPIGYGLGDKIRDSAFTVAITSFTSGQLRRWIEPECWGKLRIVHCTVGDEFLNENSPINPQSKVLLNVGRLAPQKGQVVLVEGFAEAVARGVDATLVLAGDGDMRSMIEDRSETLGVADRVRITGWVTGPEVRDLIRSSRALVMASFAEGLPMVIMEALAMGRPVASSSIAGIPELVKDGDTGWLFPSGDPASVADAIERLFSTPVDELARMADAGRDAVRREHYTPTECAKLESFILESLGYASPETPGTTEETPSADADGAAA